MTPVQSQQDTNDGTARGTGLGGMGKVGAGTDAGADRARPRGMTMNLKVLVGSGDKIGLLTLPFLIVGVILNILNPSFFSVGGPPTVITGLAIAILAIGVVDWIWSVALILTKVLRKELITSGPYAMVKHPLYTGVAVLVLPWIGVLFNSWLGFLIGFVLYVAARRFSVEEEAILSRTFGASWDDYRRRVKLPWL